MLAIIITIASPSIPSTYIITGGADADLRKALAASQESQDSTILFTRVATLSPLQPDIHNLSRLNPTSPCSCGATSQP